MKNKKGQGMEMSKILTLIIAVLVLILVSVLIFKGGAIAKFFDFLPTFGGQGEKVEGVEVLRYDIASGKVEYFDGAKGIEFSGKTVELGNKKINYSGVQNNFYDYYFDIGRRGNSIYNLPAKPYYAQLYAFGSFVLDVIPPESNMDMLIWVYQNGKNSPDVSFVLHLDNSIKDKNKLVADLDIINEVKEYFIKWRDDLVVPIKINYVDIESGRSDSITTCVKKVSIKDKVYLRVDLADPVSAETKCTSS